jgi:hypothetical protein
VADLESIKTAHPKMPSNSDPVAVKSHGPSALVAFGEQIKAEAERHKENGILESVYDMPLHTAEELNFQKFCELIDRLGEVAFSPERHYGADVHFGPIPFMIMQRLYQCSVFIEYQGTKQNFQWLQRQQQWVQLKMSSAVKQLDETDIKNLAVCSNTFRESNRRVCPMDFTDVHGPDNDRAKNRAIREEAFSLFIAQPMVAFRSKHFYFLPHKTQEQWKASREASFLVMARRILRKHSRLFGFKPVEVPLDKSFIWTLKDYDFEVGTRGKRNEVVELSDDEDASKRARRSMINELRRDEEEVVEEDNLVNAILRLVSDESGKGKNGIRISLSSFNGFVSNRGAVDVGLLNNNRIFVEECILRFLVEPILEEYLNMRKNHRNIHELDRKFLGKVADIISTKMGLAIYK